MVRKKFCKKKEGIMCLTLSPFLLKAPMLYVV